MQPATVLFDLDDTLLPDDAATAAALLATCDRAREQYHLDPAALCQSLRRQARALWTAAPTIAYCRAIGISSTEGLRATFAGADPRLQTLRNWAPTYRRQSWLGALVECGVEDVTLAERLAAAFPAERARRNVPFPEAPAVLERLQRTRHLGLVTNGSPDLQRAKLEQSGLAAYFAVVLVSGEVGIGKPEAGIFRLALERLGVAPTEAVFVGDDPARDIVGAQQAGLRAVWLNRHSLAAEGAAPDAIITGLHQLFKVLDRFAPAPTR